MLGQKLTHYASEHSYNRGMNESSTNHSEKHTNGSEAILPLPELFERYRVRLRTLIDMRLDRRVRARVDASDVLQEAFADAIRRFPEYEQERKMPPYLWLRFLTMQQLVTAHRRHLGVQARTVKAEQRLNLYADAALESGTIALSIVGAESTPSVKVSRAEEIERLTRALQQMESLDREVLALRHFEQLEHSEIGELLNLSAAAVSSRYRRALKKIGLAMQNDGT